MSDVAPKGPQNINNGEIKLNGRLIHRSFAQYNAKFVVNMGKKLR